ncbi:DUF2878 domain-containing protein, partial [Burkholderia sp.]
AGMALDLLGAQVGWFACVLSAAQGYGWMGVLCAAGLVVLYVWRVAERMRAALLVAVIALAGWMWEAVPIATGSLHYANGILVAGTAPYWLSAMWALFATQLDGPLRWLRGRNWVAALLGSIGGPLSFHAGAALGAVQFVAPDRADMLLAGGWAVLLPAAVRFSAWLDHVT